MTVKNKELEYWINLYCSGFDVTAIGRITQTHRDKITKYLKIFSVYEEPFVYTKEIIEAFANSKKATVKFPEGNLNARTSLEWTCKEHHPSFNNSASKVMGTRKQWCKLCKGQNIYDIQYFIDFAKEKGGKFKSIF